jgi:anti-sigma B factor antagonist
MNFITKNALNGQVVIIETPKRLSVEVSEEFKDILKEYVDKQKFSIIIDLSSTDYIDSNGLGAIVSQIATCRSNQGDIRLASPTVYIESLLGITNLNKILKIFKTVDLAIESYR